MPEDQAVVVVPVDVLQSLLQEVQQLRNEVHDLKEKLTVLVSTEEQDVSRICLDIAMDRQRLAKLEHKDPQPLQKDRAEILRALLAANGGKMLAKEARQKMHLSKNRFSELLKTCDFLDTKPLHSDRRKDVIILKSELVPRN